MGSREHGQGQPLSQWAAPLTGQSVDVAIIGAGTAGCAAALALAGQCEVALFDRLAEPEERIGETLPAAARRVLETLGAAAVLDSPAHAQVFVRRSRWGSSKVQELDSMADLDGPSWRLDRSAFERDLRLAVAQRGITLHAPARVSVGAVGDGWEMQTADRPPIHARFLIDATGRSSRIAASLGARRSTTDRLACVWQLAPMASEQGGVTYVEACEEGWWYSTPLPTGMRVLAFHSDADLDPIPDLARNGVVSFAARFPHLLGEIADADWASASPVRLCAAHGARLDRFGGANWLAIGDAATAFDPLSSQGLFHALYSGMRGGQTALSALAGEAAAISQYSEELENVWQAYRGHCHYFYGVERRWPEAPFWSRRQA